MNSKPTLFIGSSSEATEILGKVTALLQDSYDVLPWTSIFSINNSALDSLMSTVLKVDYAIFIGAADDEVEDVKKVRGTKIKTRDNVLFEFGLFLSVLGKGRCIYLTDEGAHTMSDYNGITVPRYTTSDIDNSLVKCITQINEHFASASRSETNLFPSATLANVYYSNFIKLICREFKANGHLKIIDGKKYNTCEIVVVLPSYISDDVNLQLQGIRKGLNLEEKSIDTNGRRRKILVDVSSKDKHIKVVDLPTIIAGVAYCIDTLFPRLKETDAQTYRKILNRELSQFRDSLIYLHNMDPCNQVEVRFLDESELADVLEESVTPKKKFTIFSFLKSSK